MAFIYLFIELFLINNVQIFNVQVFRWRLMLLSYSNVDLKMKYEFQLCSKIKPILMKYQ